MENEKEKETRSCLVLSRTGRKGKDTIVIGKGKNRVDVIYVPDGDNSCRLIIYAPAHVSVDREEIREKKGYY